MANFHQTIIAGHLGRDPETRYMNNGDAVTNFSVAVTEKWKGKDGGDKESTTWYRVNAFGKLAEICGQYLKKGSSVLVAGKMGAREWEDKDGVKRESWELRAETMQMLGGTAKPEQSKPAKPSKKAEVPDDDDSVPF